MLLISNMVVPPCHSKMVSTEALMRGNVAPCFTVAQIDRASIVDSAEMAQKNLQTAESLIARLSASNTTFGSNSAP